MRRTKPPFPVLNRGHRLAQGLVASWMFWEGSGTTIHDVSGNDHHGTWIGASGGSNTTPGWVAGRDGWAMELGSSSNYVIASLPDIKSAGSISAWATFTGSSGTNRYIFSHRSGATNSRIYLFSTSSGEMSASYGNTQIVGEKIPSGWFHATMTWNAGSLFSLYVNGTISASGNANTFSGNWSPIVNLGKYVVGTSGYWVGQLGQFLVHNRALSADEIAELYHDPYGMFRHNRAIRAMISVGSKPWLYRPKNMMLGGV